MPLQERRPTFAGIKIEPTRSISAALIVEAPADAKPGDPFRFDALQKRSDHIVGGSTYFVAVMKAARRWDRVPRLAPVRRAKTAEMRELGVSGG